VRLFTWPSQIFAPNPSPSSSALVSHWAWSDGSCCQLQVANSVTCGLTAAHDVQQLSILNAKNSFNDDARFPSVGCSPSLHDDCNAPKFSIPNRVLIKGSKINLPDFRVSYCRWRYRSCHENEQRLAVGNNRASCWASFAISCSWYFCHTPRFAPRSEQSHGKVCGSSQFQHF
jgi:hypothetical protein